MAEEGREQAEHKHDFRDRLVEVRHYPTSATVGIFRCDCGTLFPRPLTADERATARGQTMPSEGREQASKRFPVTDDVVWCDPCDNYHLPNQHDVFSGEARRLTDGVLARDEQVVAEVQRLLAADPIEAQP